MSDEIDEAIDELAGNADPAQVPDPTPEASGTIELDAGLGPAGEAEAGAGAEAAAEGSSAFEKLFLEPADMTPSQVHGHPIVELIQEGITSLATSPREAFAYLAKCGVVTLDKFDVPIGGKKPLPVAVYAGIGIVVVIASLVFGTDDGDTDQDDDADDDVDEDLPLKEQLKAADGEG
jgi:hypothetical protein